MSLLKTYLEKIQNRVQIDGVLRNVSEFEIPNDEVEILSNLKFNLKKEWKDFDRLEKTKECYIFVESIFNCIDSHEVSCSSVNFQPFLYKENRNYTTKEILSNSLVEKERIELDRGTAKVLGVSNLSGNIMTDDLFKYFYNKYCSDFISIDDLRAKENWIRIEQNENLVTLQIVVGRTNN